MKRYDVAAYVWPAYTGKEPRARIFWPEGIGEWETVKAARPRFEGHPWPRKPLWGYVDEADPAVMEREIAEARKYGVNVFIYDWYWYDRRPFLENCLNDGFLKAPNSKEMKFYLMWANHNANYLWDKRLAGSDVHATPVWSGEVDRAEFERMASRLIETYFSLENYYTIDGRPVFMIFHLPNFIRGLGGLDGAARAVEWLREEMLRRGFPGLFLQLCVQSPRQIPDAAGVGSDEKGTYYPEAVRRLAADGVTHYSFGAFTPPKGDYSGVIEAMKAEYPGMEKTYGAPYFPCVGLGWDNNSRHPNVFKPSIITGNTPEKVEAAFRLAKDYVDSHSLPAPLVTINSWNEWTEDSYLQPDDLRGTAFLEALRRVFGA